MKRIHVIAILLFTMLTISVNASAQKKFRQHRYVPKTVSLNEVINSFKQYVEDIPYLSEASIQSKTEEVDAHTDKLRNWKDRKAYAEENDLAGFISREREELNKLKEGVAPMVDQFMKQYNGVIIPDSAGCRDSLEFVLNDKLGRVETSLNVLDREVNTKGKKEDNDLPWGLIGGLIAGLLALILIIWALVSAGKKKKKYTPAPVITPQTAAKPGEAGIVVRRKTATILKRQSLEDVIDNPHYMKIDLEDCCYESAVRRMYIKDTCIIDIYNMYLSDRKDPDNAKEYGCMVLGRWVFDAENNEYYVSLEHIILPGEDAVFDEYELNFGGIIKLRILEQLRKLRRETNLQYDLTCWVHSHPGLTVFFSNADSNVQDQLKHPQHPKFLTALVIDTLTPTMETGIFTYHRDMTLNTRNDMKKLYSLEEWYQWAMKSMESKETETPEPKSLDHSLCFNTLADAKEHTTTCFGINVTKDMVIDLCMALSNQANGIAGYIYGQANKKDQLTEYTAERLSDKDNEANAQLVGCFVVTPHFSIPSIRKILAGKLDDIKFVLVYVPAEGVLTSIPVMSDDLCSYESYYGVQKLEDLKSWTKKGR